MSDTAAFLEWARGPKGVAASLARMVTEARKVKAFYCVVRPSTMPSRFWPKRRHRMAGK